MISRSWQRFDRFGRGDVMGGTTMMMRIALSGAACAAALAAATPALAQETEDAAQLLAMDVPSLRPEIDNRYEAALAATRDPSVVNANDARYLWASEAKAQCGIAHGYLLRSIKDEVSITKCADFYQRMLAPPAPPPPPPPPPMAPAVCDDIPGIVFFEFDSAVIAGSAQPTLDSVVSNASACQWNSIAVEGHTDLSGSDAYNRGLSERRAQAVADALAARGLSRSSLTVSGVGETQPRVPTADGVREAQNRRVEITLD